MTLGNHWSIKHYAPGGHLKSVEQTAVQSFQTQFAAEIHSEHRPFLSIEEAEGHSFCDLKRRSLPITTKH